MSLRELQVGQGLETPEHEVTALSSDWASVRLTARSWVTKWFDKMLKSKIPYAFKVTLRHSNVACCRNSTKAYRASRQAAARYVPFAVICAEVVKAVHQARDISNST